MPDLRNADTGMLVSADADLRPDLDKSPGLLRVTDGDLK